MPCCQLDDVYCDKAKATLDQIVPSVSAPSVDVPAAAALLLRPGSAILEQPVLLPGGTGQFSRKVFVGGLPPDIDEGIVH